MRFFLPLVLAFAQLAFADNPQPDTSEHSMHHMPMHHMHPMEQNENHPSSPEKVHTHEGHCSEDEVLDVSAQMCRPYPGTPVSLVMLHGNAFGTFITEQGPRGRTAFAIPNFFMATAGKSFGSENYLNLDLMGTFEKWTYPSAGYPELLQIGEENEAGLPYLDAQHPHSSPIMGLTLSDTIRISGDRNFVKLSFAPRGESTDGPIAFMHRPTGFANPDAPLGHHIGQDVGHISSTVFAAELKLAGTHFEASAFNGTEPAPTSVDLPLGTPNSFALRAVQEFSPELTAMASLAYVQNPEPHFPDIASENRVSASFYTDHPVSSGWRLHTATIFGWISRYDHADSLMSFAEEFLLKAEGPSLWGRFEVLQRTAEELAIASPNPNSGLWVGALTLGYTHALWKGPEAALGLGASGTVDFLPAEFAPSYGGTNPLSAKIFLQLSGMKMWGM